MHAGASRLLVIQHRVLGQAQRGRFKMQSRHLRLLHAGISCSSPNRNGNSCSISPQQELVKLDVVCDITILESLLAPA